MTDSRAGRRETHGTVMLSTVLFFAAVSSKMASPRGQFALLAVGTLLFLAALGRIATLPVTLGN